jgi:hypothetical protein
LGWRAVWGLFSGARGAGDLRLYWGAAGHVDSVIDLTHNTVVPGPETAGGNYANHIGASWGILNASAVTLTQPDGNALLSIRDFACVEPIPSVADGNNTFTCPNGTTRYALSATAVPAAVSHLVGGGSAAPVVTANDPGNTGFILYISGELYTVALQGGALPTAGTAWTLRRYVGAITGGVGSAGDFGPYAFTNPEHIRPLTAPGASLLANYEASNTLAAATSRDLRAVHTVPDPYYVTSGYEQTTDTKIIKFVNLPSKAIIRIYSSSGVLVNLLENPGASCQNVSNTGSPINPIGGECTWNVRNRNNQVVASGVYFYHIEANVAGGTARRVGRMTIVNFAQ